MNISFTMPRVAGSLGRFWAATAASDCGLSSCSRAKSLWRYWWRRHAVRFDGVLYCPQCLETAVREELWRLQCQVPLPPPSNRIPLGLLMIARGKLSYGEVAAALEAQRRARYGNIGEWFEKLGFATEQDVTAALGLQWGCPVALSLLPESNGTSQLVPLAILEDLLMWPLHRVPVTNTLYIACGNRVDYGALAAIEKMLGCRTQPCVASPKLIASHIERVRHEPRAGEVVFRSMRDPAEMVRIAISYISRIGAEEIRSSRLGSTIWLLLKNRSTSLNLLFQLGSPAPRTLQASRSHSADAIEAVRKNPPWKTEPQTPSPSALNQVQSVRLNNGTARAKVITPNSER